MPGPESSVDETAREILRLVNELDVANKAALSADRSLRVLQTKERLRSLVGTEGEAVVLRDSVFCTAALAATSRSPHALQALCDDDGFVSGFVAQLESPRTAEQEAQVRQRLTEKALRSTLLDIACENFAAAAQWNAYRRFHCAPSIRVTGLPQDAALFVGHLISMTEFADSLDRNSLDMAVLAADRWVNEQIHYELRKNGGALGEILYRPVLSDVVERAELRQSGEALKPPALDPAVAPLAEWIYENDAFLVKIHSDFAPALRRPPQSWEFIAFVTLAAHYPNGSKPQFEALLDDSLGLSAVWFSELAGYIHDKLPSEFVTGEAKTSFDNVVTLQCAFSWIKELVPKLSSIACESPAAAIPIRQGLSSIEATPAFMMFFTQFPKAGRILAATAFEMHGRNMGTQPIAASRRDASTVVALSSLQVASFIAFAAKVSAVNPMLGALYVTHAQPLLEQRFNERAIQTLKTEECSEIRNSTLEALSTYLNEMPAPTELRDLAFNDRVEALAADLAGTGGGRGTPDPGNFTL